MAEIVKASGFQPLTPENLKSGEAATVLNAMLRFLFDKISANGEEVDISMGYGTPESNHTRKIGSLYMRLDGGAGTTLYVKESGDMTNTGWAGV